MNFPAKFNVLLLTAICCYPGSPFYTFQGINASSCPNIKVQTGVSIEKMTGRWHLVEILEHLAPKKPYYVDKCIRIHIHTTRENELIMEWKEEDYKVEYEFVIDNRSIWKSKGAQRQDPEVLGYQQFAGNVYVVKAADNNAVLTFCSPGNIYYSLVMVRNLPISKTDLDSIHNILQRFEMAVLSARQYCKNGTVRVSNNSILVIFFFILIFLATNYT